MGDIKRIVAIVGSLRQGSFNRTLARYAAWSQKKRADISILEIDDVPFMNQDIEFPAPEAVTRIRDAVTRAQGVWFFTPEYNSSFPAPTKNVVDWLSRPVVAGDYSTPRPLTQKPVAISGVGGKRRTASVRKSLFDLLSLIGATVIGADGEGFTVPGQTWQTGRYDIPAEDRARLDRQGEEFIAAL
ncbi:NADPH-dependent FMN reductase [Coriobacterium glomerans PW2]|uniref:NADPH-dependent FMN reductase n=1 Tax=Coriobacterium glomerans (strain ATCC 49209 / DSM 20642 / JCM 10262 / PW2) TaxID=700015 RepID=F2N7F2_CORGP|nr:NADPH-dependent FMN reductase [Coriobacterium glomerans]AEB06768.1 NADPH-dependent FMN reductase [Coriobacterium glomerans PW2]